MKLSALERAGQIVVLPDRALQCRLCELVSATVRQRLVGDSRADVCLSRARQVGLL